jgi:hypothetical protein
MFPSGFVPGKDDSEAYVRLYDDPNFTLAERISSLDLSM